MTDSINSDDDLKKDYRMIKSGHYMLSRNEPEEGIIG
jgi:hypothetical protein